MPLKSHNIRYAIQHQPIPFDLLLLADPSVDKINEYINQSDWICALIDDEVIGVIVLYPLSNVETEIKNVAVHPNFQRQGIGTELIHQGCLLAKQQLKKSMCIGTANSSIYQLYLYQKLGFEITSLETNFFLDHYSESIFENGIQAKHLIRLIKEL